MIGFSGVLLVVQPDANGIHAGYGFALLTVVVMVARDLITRKLPSDTPSLLVAFGSATSITVVALIVAGPTLLTPFTITEGLSLAAAAFFIFLGYTFVILGVRSGEFGAVAPFRYTGIVFALLLGWLVFGEFPAPLVLLGSAIIVTSGLYSLFRENKLAKADNR